jgi:hypothetical protein
MIKPNIASKVNSRKKKFLFLEKREFTVILIHPSHVNE